MILYPARLNQAHINLPASKSESNRILIINYLSGNKIHINNLSQANDTIVLQEIINSIDRKHIFDAVDAGTAYRFATALLSTIERESILTGSEQMKLRPIGVLVNALRQLGIEITYIEKENYPPLLIKGKKNIKGTSIELDSSISSQYISALMMIAPLFKNGLKIKFTSSTVSKPYILMTISLMQKFGAKVLVHEPVVAIEKSIYTGGLHTVENDWSAASYWYSLCALTKGAQYQLNGLKENSLQGDAIVAKIFKNFGVETTFNSNGCLIQKKGDFAPDIFEYNFTDCPDLAQTIACVCAGLKIRAHLKGLKTLKIKETDRIEALKTELHKFGVITHTDNDSFTIKEFAHAQKNIMLNTYQDHRMAMSFAPLANVYGKFEIDDPQVVKKSYPNFWQEWNKLT